MYIPIVILLYYYADNTDIGTYNNNILTTSESIICVHNVMCQSDTGTF